MSFGTWAELVAGHQILRQRPNRDTVQQIREVLKRAEAGDLRPLDGPKDAAERRLKFFEQGLASRLQPRGNQGNGLKSYSLRTEGKEGEEFLVWDALDDQYRQKYGRKTPIELVHLTVLLLLNHNDTWLHQLSIMAQADLRDGKTWTIAVHLESDRPNLADESDDKGHGACGHAVLHAHWGPTLDDRPKVRVPLPPVEPGMLLEWVLSQVLVMPEFESAPW